MSNFGYVCVNIRLQVHFWQTISINGLSAGKAATAHCHVKISVWLGSEQHLHRCSSSKQLLSLHYNILTGCKLLAAIDCK